MSTNSQEPQSSVPTVTTEWTTYSSQSTGSAGSSEYTSSKVTSSSYISAAPATTPSIALTQSMPTNSSSSSSTPNPQLSGSADIGGLQLDRSAIIAASVVGLLLIAILLVSVCLARSRRRQRNGDDNRASAAAKTPRPAPAGAAVITREPNPYTNPCFMATKDEMGERVRKTEEPAKSTTEGINSVRNKEDQWIIPLEELADSTMANFDTTKF